MTASLHLGYLKRGIAAAKSGRAGSARSALLLAADLEPGDIRIWLWLAYAARNRQEAQRCVQRALSIDPENEQARRWWRRLRKSDPAEWRCPLCRTTASRPAARCHSCKAVLEGSSILDFFQGTAELDRDAISSAMERLTAQPPGEGGFERAWALAVGALNLGQLAQASTALALAARTATTAHPAAALLAELEREGGKSLDLPEPSAEDQAIDPPPSAARIAREPSDYILVVDDSPTVRRVVEMTLTRAGYEVRCAADGLLALEQIEAEVPALVFLDVTMPNLDGYDLCRAIRNNEDTAKTPVVMLTGRDRSDDKLQGRIAGATAYLTKPVEPSTLLEALVQYEVPRNEVVVRQ